MQIFGMPPPLCNVGKTFEYTNGQNLGKDLFFFIFMKFCAKNRTNFERRPFFWSTRTDSEWRKKFFGLHYFQISWPPPLSKILRTLLFVSYLNHIDYNSKPMGSKHLFVQLLNQIKFHYIRCITE